MYQSYGEQTQEYKSKTILDWDKRNSINCLVINHCNHHNIDPCYNWECSAWWI